MLTAINPKLTMRDKAFTFDFYVNKLGFLLYKYTSSNSKRWKLKENYGQVYVRTDNIENLYKGFQESGVEIHPNGRLQTKRWRQREFSILDPDNNLLTFGQSL